jgi:glutamyl-tRNA synthetase
MRVRFAPSPTGYLHVGNARTALFNWLLARGAGGTFVLRVEDTDAERSTRQSEVAILRDLRWLGLEWDEGPDIGGPHGPYRQSERLEIYAAHGERLLASGQAYRCFCSVEELEAERQDALRAGRPAKYSGKCRTLLRAEAEARVATGARPALRFRVPDDREVVFEDAVRGELRFHTDVIGDPVIVRGDGTPAYNFAVVVDDSLMEVTHVVRGEDHISNTPRQLLLYEALGLAPPRFAHLSLVMGPDHTPLSKRHGATSVAEFRAKGYLPQALVNYLALIGWSPGGGDELLPLEELARRFALESVVASAGVFDEEKLAWANRHHLKTEPVDRLAALSVDFFSRAGYPMVPAAAGLDFLASVMPIAAGSVDRLDQVPERLAFLFDYDPRKALALPEVAEEMQSEGARAVAAALAEGLASAPRLDRERFRAMAGAIRDRTSQKGRALFHPIRVALTGRAEGPELDLAVPAIDRGAELPLEAGLPRIVGCRERAGRFARALADLPSRE